MDSLLELSPRHLEMGISFSSLEEPDERRQKRNECTKLAQKGILCESLSAPETPMNEAEADVDTRDNNGEVYGTDIEALWRT
jgi:hypothetical protein